MRVLSFRQQLSTSYTWQHFYNGATQREVFVRSVQLLVTVVVPDGVADEEVVKAISGRAIPDVAGSWVAQVAATRGDPVSSDCEHESSEHLGLDLFADVLEAEANADAGI